MDEELNYEAAGLVGCVESLAQGLNQSLVIGYRTLLIIRLLSLVSQEEPVWIKKIAVLLVDTRLVSSQILQVVNMHLLDFLSSLKQVLERLRQSVYFVFGVAETEHGL